MRLGHHAPSHPRPPRATLHLRRHPNRPQRQNLPAAALRLRRNRLYRTARVTASPATPCSNASLPPGLPPKASRTDKRSKSNHSKGRLKAPPPKQTSFQTTSKTHSAALSCKRSTNAISASSATIPTCTAPSTNCGFGSKTKPNRTPRPNTKTATYSNAASPSPKPHTGGDRTSVRILIVIVKVGWLEKNRSNKFE